MTLGQIHHVIAVAETASIFAAAPAVLISQSSPTLAIQQLQEEIGVRLINLHRRRISCEHTLASQRRRSIDVKLVPFARADETPSPAGDATH